MKPYSRQYPEFALCGLNCGLCPRYHTKGVSKCPGCGGPEFHIKHPTCAIITCSKKQQYQNIEFCYQCPNYTCERYKKPSEIDSFITYKNVIKDLQKAKLFGIDNYLKEQTRKKEILTYLLNNFNDGKRKNFFCLSVNLIELTDLEFLINKIQKEIELDGPDLKEKVKRVVNLFESIAQERGIELKLRK